MLYMSQARISRHARRWAWAHRRLEALDNPVRRYLRDHSVGYGINKRRPGLLMGWLGVRPAT
jgi:hypothetical protein